MNTWKSIACLFAVALLAFLLGRASRSQIVGGTSSELSAGREKAISQGTPITTRLDQDRASVERSTDSREVSVLSNRPRIPGAMGGLIGPNGILASGLARQLGLDEDQASHVQAAVSSLWANARSSLAERAIYDERLSNEDDGVYVYRIPASEDRGKSLIESFRGELINYVDEEKVSAVVNSLDMQMFGGFGKYDVELKFSDDQSRVDAGESNATKAEFLYINPDTGEKFLTGVTSWRGFVERFGEWTLK